MRMVLNPGGGNKDLTGLFVGTAGGNKEINQLWVGTAGGNQLVFAKNVPGLLTVTLTGYDSEWQFDIAVGYYCDGTYTVTGGTGTYPTGGVGIVSGVIEDATVGGGTFTLYGDDWPTPATFNIQITDSLGNTGTSGDGTVDTP